MEPHPVTADEIAAVLRDIRALSDARAPHPHSAKLSLHGRRNSSPASPSRTPTKQSTITATKTTSPDPRPTTSAANLTLTCPPDCSARPSSYSICGTNCSITPAMTASTLTYANSSAATSSQATRPASDGTTRPQPPLPTNCRTSSTSPPSSSSPPCATDHAATTSVNPRSVTTGHRIRSTRIRSSASRRELDQMQTRAGWHTPWTDSLTRQRQPLPRSHRRISIKSNGGRAVELRCCACLATRRVF